MSLRFRKVGDSMCSSDMAHRSDSPLNPSNREQREIFRTERRGAKDEGTDLTDDISADISTSAASQRSPSIRLSSRRKAALCPSRTIFYLSCHRIGRLLSSCDLFVCLLTVGMTQGEGQNISGDIISILNHVPCGGKNGRTQFDWSSESYSVIQVVSGCDVENKEKINF